MNTIDLKGIRATIYKVSDLNEAQDWYSKCFGKTAYFVEPYYVGFNIGGYELGLLLDQESHSNKSSNVLAYWAVSDITDAYDQMISNGAKELEMPNDVGDGVKVALVRDPWGNVLGLIYNPFFKEKYHKNVRVEIATFQTKNDVSIDQLQEASRKLETQFLMIQKGYIKRELLQKTSNEWVDLIYWEDQQAAENAFAMSQNNEAAIQYFELMNTSEVDNNSDAVSHYSILEY